LKAMSCAELRARLHPYVDAELPVGEMTAADAHCAECYACAQLVARAHELRRLLRRQLWATPSPDLLAAIVRRLRREAALLRVRRSVLPAAVAASTTIILLALLLASRPAPALVTELVDKHIAYAQVDRPAELASH